MPKETKKTIGKRIASLKNQFKTAVPSERKKLIMEIVRLENLKKPGSVIYIKDAVFFQNPSKGGHLYLVDEYNGQRVSVNRISHSKKPVNKVELTSMPKAKDGTPTYAQLDVIYTGKKGKPIKIKKQHEPNPGMKLPSANDKVMVRRTAKRDETAKAKWGSNK